VAVKLNNQTLINPQQLAVLVRTFEDGDEVKLTIMREGKSVELKVKLIERAAKPINRVLFGMMPDDVRPLKRGDDVRVTIFDLEGPGKSTVKQTVVSEAGEIRLPYLNRSVRAAGLTQVALQQAIAAAYRVEKILEAANVSVERYSHSDPQFVAQPIRTIQQNDMVMVTMHDVEGPGIATVKQARIGPAGTVNLPRLAKPVPAIGCTPVELEKSVLDLYRSAGVANGGTVGVSVSVPSALPVTDVPKNQ
jgi:protein involved in polysaccharide export with SLBB domain